MAKQPDITRELILQAAFCEIHRHGYQAASIVDILAVTQMTKGALYHHFPGKQEMGLAVIDEVIRDRLEEKLMRPLRLSTDPVAALLELIRDTAARTGAEEVNLGCPLNNLMQEMSPLDAAFKQRLMGILGDWQDTVAAALARGQRDGTVRADVDCRAAALFIVSSWEGCTGVAKNAQSVAVFQSCLQQLHDYVAGLRVAETDGDARRAGSSKVATA
jgi:AcrR family transcriptional regulator